MKKIQTLLFQLDETGRELLLMLKRKKVGAGRRMGTGGNKESKDADLRACVMRESQEEIGIEPRKLCYMGVVEFAWPSGVVHVVHMFTATGFIGELRESEEMQDPRWYPIESLPWDDMWPSDALWVREMFERGFVNLHIRYDESGEVLATSPRNESLTQE